MTSSPSSHASAATVAPLVTVLSSLLLLFFITPSLVAASSSSSSTPVPPPPPPPAQHGAATTISHHNNHHHNHNHNHNNHHHRRSSGFSRGTACVYEDKVLAPGARFKPDPCTSCRCPRGKDPGGQAVCTVEDCRQEPSCLRHSNVTSRGYRSCCPECAEHGCRHTDGVVYRAGETISRDGCSTCYCPLAAAGYGQQRSAGPPVVTCRVTSCPPVMCVDFVPRPGSCCPRCPHGWNCQLGVRTVRLGAVVAAGDGFCRCGLRRRGANFKLEAICFGSKGEARTSRAETYNRKTLGA